MYLFFFNTLLVHNSKEMTGNKEVKQLMDIILTLKPQMIP